MDFKIIFKATFVSDLELIVRSIADRNPEAALKLGEHIIQTGENLRFFPERHPKLRQRSGIRRVIVRKYFKLFYRIDQERQSVEVLRCWDGRRGHNPSISGL